MIRALTFQEPFLARHYEIDIAVRISSSYSPKDIAREFSERSPIFSLRIENDHFYKSDPVITQLPISITELESALYWKMATPSANAADLAYGRDIVVMRWNHAVGDGCHGNHLLSSIGKPLKRARPYLWSLDELLGKHQFWGKPTSLNLSEKGMFFEWSHPVRPCSTLTELSTRTSLNKFSCYDPQKKRARKLTEHSWAALICANIVHNWMKTGRFDLNRSGIVTLATLRHFMDPSIEVMNVGNAFSRVIPTAGELHLEETLGQITDRLRRSMDQQMKDGEPVRMIGKTLEPPPGAPLMLSNPGTVQFAPAVVDLVTHEEVVGIDPQDTSEWNVVVTECGIRFPDRIDQWVLTQFNESRLSYEDGKHLDALIWKGLRNLTLDVTLAAALKEIYPKIKEAL
jgi:hypothetical protein